MSSSARFASAARPWSTYDQNSPSRNSIGRVRAPYWKPRVAMSACGAVACFSARWYTALALPGSLRYRYASPTAASASIEISASGGIVSNVATACFISPRAASATVRSPASAVLTGEYSGVDGIRLSRSFAAASALSIPSKRSGLVIERDLSRPPRTCWRIDSSSSRARSTAENTSGRAFASSSALTAPPLDARPNTSLRTVAGSAVRRSGICAFGAWASGTWEAGGCAPGACAFGAGMPGVDGLDVGAPGVCGSGADRAANRAEKRQESTCRAFAHSMPARSASAHSAVAHPARANPVPTRRAASGPVCRWTRRFH